MNDEILRRSWVEVDLDQLKRNVLIYRTQIEPEKQIMAVVKADAYGNGDVEVVQALCEIGIAHVALDTGMNRIGIKAEILVHCEEVIRDWSTSYNLTGAFTHLCIADSNDLEPIIFQIRR